MICQYEHWTEWSEHAVGLELNQGLQGWPEPVELPSVIDN